MMNKEKILICATDNRFWRRTLGSQQRIYALLNYLHKHSINIEVFFTGGLEQEDIQPVSELAYKVILYKDYLPVNFSTPFYIKKIIRSVSHHITKLLNLLSDILYYREIDTSPILTDYHNVFVEEAFRHYLSRKDNKNIILLIEYLRIAYLKDVAQDQSNQLLFSIVDTIDTSYIRHHSMRSKKLQSDLRINKVKEGRLLDTFDYVLAIQKKEQKQFEHLCHKARVLLVSHSVSVKLINEAKPHTTFNIGFIGSSMESNVYGVNWFINEVLSQLKDHKIIFNIAGDICKKIKTPLIEKNRVVLHGFVDKIELFYQQNDLIIAPIFSGGGLKIKTVEALCYGKALITTSVGSEGLSLTDDAFLFYDNKEQWIIEIKKLIKNKKQIKKIEDNAYQYALNTFTPEVCYGELTKILSCDRDTS